MQSVNKKASIITAIALSTALSQSVLANEPATPTNTVTSSDLSYAFDQSAGPVQVLALSDQEMKETEGEWGPWGAVIGAIAGGAQYIGYATTCGCESSMTGFVANVGGGAVIGAIGGPAGIGNAILGSQVGFYGGMAGGAIENGINTITGP